MGEKYSAYIMLANDKVIVGIDDKVYCLKDEKEMNLVEKSLGKAGIRLLGIVSGVDKSMEGAKKAYTRYFMNFHIWERVQEF